eukprot:m.277395 g.277395  ORF g.277395 m.277395 type:complete len:140 (+) comp16306_c0_seq12:295-714(+)
MGKEDFLQAAVVLYAFTGWLQPLLVDALRLSGGIEIGLGPSLLPNLANTLGMACVPLSERMLVYMAKACNFKSALEGFEGDSFTDPFLSLDTLKQAPKPAQCLILAQRKELLTGTCLWAYEFITTSIPLPQGAFAHHSC